LFLTLAIAKAISAIAKAISAIAKAISAIAKAISANSKAISMIYLVARQRILKLGLCQFIAKYI
jgi:hypothetical protein